MGRGSAAVAAAEQVAARKADRVAEQERRQAELALTDQVAFVSAEAKALVAAALVEAGYWRPPGRKPWRKRRSRRI